MLYVNQPHIVSENIVVTCNVLDSGASREFQWQLAHVTPQLQCYNHVSDWSAQCVNETRNPDTTVTICVHELVHLQVVVRNAVAESCIGMRGAMCNRRWCGRGSCYGNRLSLGYLSNSRSEKRKLIVERFDLEGLHQLQNWWRPSRSKLLCTYIHTMCIVWIKADIKSKLLHCNVWQHTHSITIIDIANAEGLCHWGRTLSLIAVYGPTLQLTLDPSTPSNILNRNQRSSSATKLMKTFTVEMFYY